MRAAGSFTCDTVKLRGVPKVLFTKQLWKRSCGRVNSPGYGNSNRNVTMDYPQPSPKESMGVVDKNLQCLSQMPRHLISDAHEWINEIPTGTGLAKSAGKEDPVELDSSLTLWKNIEDVE
ncbi:hypothetical protein PCANB_000878 [Pneumocystis canis]|nr:hypothetical protein PCANB_000878 [Pneumocystis canis]